LEIGSLARNEETAIGFKTKRHFDTQRFSLNKGGEGIARRMSKGQEYSIILFITQVCDFSFL
jgi:hypothetical protein